jgi:hypothetical protein
VALRRSMNMEASISARVDESIVRKKDALVP